MYRITWYDNPYENNGVTIHEPANFGEKITSGMLNLSLEGLGISTFEFTINQKNRMYRRAEPIVHHIKIEDSKKNVVFKGRIYKITNTMTSNGEFSQKIACEDKKAYLHDSTQKYMKPTVMSVSDYLKKMLDEHNSQVDSYKQIKLGDVTVKEDGNVYRGLAYGQTSDVIREKLLDRLGGYLILRESNSLLYLDYLQQYGKDSKTPLQIAKNLQSASREIDIDELATRVVPLGKDIETDETIEIGSDFSNPKINISSVNGGKDYIQDESLIEVFGVIQKELYYSDIENPNILKKNAENYLKEQRLMLVTWSVDVIEVGLLDNRYEMITLGDHYLISNPYLYENERLQVINKIVDILNPQSVSVVVGSGKQTLSQYQLSQKEIGKQIENVQSALSINRTAVQELRQQNQEIDSRIDSVADEQQALINEKLTEQNKILQEKLEDQQKVNEEVKKEIEELRLKIESELR